jgi:hypothetical protein
MLLAFASIAFPEAQALAAGEDQKQSEQEQNPSKGGDPVQTLKALVASFPNESIRKSTGSPYKIADVSFDVRRTDSLVNPIVGVVNFSTVEEFSLDFQLVFHWDSDRWVFSRLINRENGKDFTNMGGGEDILGAGAMKRLIDKYK